MVDEPAISEIKYLGAGTEDFIEVRIPDDYPDPENLVLIIYDRNDDGSTTATSDPADEYIVILDLTPIYDTEDDGYTHYVVGTDYNGTTIYLHQNDAVGLYNQVTGETYGLYSFGNPYTVSEAVDAPNGSADPFAGQDTTVLPTTNGGESLGLNPDGSYSVITPTPGSSFICFGAGTMIATPQGERPIETLRPGDLVETKDNGPMPIQWIGASSLILRNDQREQLSPICLPKGCLGPNRPNQDLYLSPNHGVLWQDGVTELFFGQADALIDAKALQGTLGIRQDLRNVVTYYHILLEGHQLICSNGLWSESLFRGDQTDLVAMKSRHRELIAIFGQEALQGSGHSSKTVRRRLKNHEARVLIGAEG